MRNPSDIILALESDNSRLAKEAIIAAEAKAGNADFFEGCRIALDAMITFGLKAIPEKTDADGPGLEQHVFTLAITGFVSRQVTGHAARDMVANLMKYATKSEWNNWYRRILIKDLRCGVSEKTINNVVAKQYPDFAVPVFSCQLAHDSANHESKVCGKKIVEIKLDGVRVLTIVYPEGRVDQFSRNGKELLNFGHIKDQFQKVAAGLTEPWVFDGEVMSSSFQDLMKQVHRKDNVKASDAVLHLFDSMPLADFELGKCKLTQMSRSKELSRFMTAHAADMPNVTMVGQELVDLDTGAGEQRFKEINAQAIAGGYEGIMIKDPDAYYECKRSTAWLKLKPFIEVSLEITDVEEGTGKNKGKLGALVCSGEDDGRTIVVNVGSGFTDADRDRFYSARSSLPGNVVEVRADAITQNQDGTYSLRFPRFLRFRGFAPHEKI
jgi:DNA ligase-1